VNGLLKTILPEASHGPQRYRQSSLPTNARISKTTSSLAICDCSVSAEVADVAFVFLRPPLSVRIVEESKLVTEENDQI
jgi:hypothetical protein